MDAFQLIVILFAIFQASLQLDNYNWTESVSDYSKNYKFMSITELFLCDSNVHRVVKSLNERGIYCNVNLIENATFGHNNRKLAKILSSINLERHTSMIVDVRCALKLLKLINLRVTGQKKISRNFREIWLFFIYTCNFVVDLL